MNTHPDTAYIRALIAEGEHQRQDFKYEISDARKIARTLSAFANTDGGRLLVGVKDNGKIAGTRIEEEAYMIDAAARMYCRPQVAYSLRVCQAESRNVLVAEIERSEQRPVRAQDDAGRWMAYLRIADENILATRVHLMVWQQSRREQGELVEYTGRERLLFELLSRYGCLSLNRYCRLAHLSRKAAEHLLAKFIRYGIVEAVFETHRFYFQLKH